MLHLTDAQRETLRLQLNARSGALREEIDRLVRSPGRSTEGVADELNAIFEALARAQSGDYGICEDCRAPIGYERLLSRPEASHCTRCATERERRRAEPSLPRP